MCGDHNSVIIQFRGTELHLRKLHGRSREIKHLRDLLLPETCATDLIGHAGNLADLAAWRDGPRHVGVRCIIGRAGVGKTRLAIEAGGAAEAAQAHWQAGFVSSSELERFHKTSGLVHWRVSQPTLIVIDYAATSAKVLQEWFAALAPERDSEHNHKIRILLLERHADLEQGWWADLARLDSRSRDCSGYLLEGVRPHNLVGISAVEDRRALLRNSMALAANVRGTVVLKPPQAGHNSAFDARLADPYIENEPLYLILAAIRASEYGAPAALTLGLSDLVDGVVQEERARLKRLAQARGLTDGGAFLHHLVACVTLQNGCAINAIEALIKEELRSCSFRSPERPRELVPLLAEYLATSSSTVEPLRPDLIGEAFLISEFAGRNAPDVVQAIVLRGHARAPVGTVETLIRAACDLGGGSAAHPAVVWLGGLVSASYKLDEAILIYNSLPQGTLALREFAAKILGNILQKLRLAARSNQKKFAPHLAACLNDYANRLGALGRHEEAVTAVREAVKLRRGLAVARSDDFTACLATSLNGLGNRLRDLGRHEEGLAAAGEAVELYRALAAVRSEAFTPDLARSLMNYVGSLSAFGRHDEALVAAHEAVQLYRASAATRPDSCLSNLAMALNDCVKPLADLGRYEEALAAAREAVELYRALAAARPDAFTPDLARSLNNHSSSLYRHRHYRGALVAAREAVALYRALAAARPGAFTPDLASSLNYNSACLGACGSHGEALTAARETVELYRSLAAVRPDAFNSDLAGTLTNLANRFGVVHRYGEARACAREAVEGFRALAAARPDAFTPELARSLWVLSMMVEAHGQRAEAVPPVREAIELLAPYFIDAPAIFAETIAKYIGQYIRRAKATRISPDFALLNPIMVALKQYKEVAYEPGSPSR